MVLWRILKSYADTAIMTAASEAENTHLGEMGSREYMVVS